MVKKKSKGSRKPKQFSGEINWLAVNEPFNLMDRLEAFGLMWADTAGTIPEDEEEKAKQKETMAIETAKDLQRLKDESRGNTFVVGQCKGEYIAGLHYRKASTMSRIPKLSVLMFYCQHDYVEGGLGDVLMSWLKNLSMAAFGGGEVEVSIKARSQPIGKDPSDKEPHIESELEVFLARHGFVLDLGTFREGSPGWYVATFQF